MSISPLSTQAQLCTHVLHSGLCAVFSAPSTCPLKHCPSFTTPLKYHFLQQSFPDSPVYGSLPSLPRAPQTLLFVPLLLHFYSLSLCEVSYVCACLLWASKRLIEVKTIALASDSPDFTSDELVWPWAFCVTSWSPIIFRDKTGILIYFPHVFLVGFTYLFVFKKCIIMHLPHAR